MSSGLQRPTLASKPIVTNGGMDSVQNRMCWPTRSPPRKDSEIQNRREILPKRQITDASRGARGGDNNSACVWIVRCNGDCGENKNRSTVTCRSPRFIGILLHDSMVTHGVPGSGAWQCAGMCMYCHGILGPRNLGKEGEKNMTGIVGRKACQDSIIWRPKIQARQKIPTRNAPDHATVRFWITPQIQNQVLGFSSCMEHRPLR